MTHVTHLDESTQPFLSWPSEAPKSIPSKQTTVGKGQGTAGTIKAMTRVTEDRRQTRSKKVTCQRREREQDIP